MQSSTPHLLRGDKEKIEMGNPTDVKESSGPVTPIAKARIKTGSFLFYWAAIFLCLFSFLYGMGFAPDGVLEVGDTITATVDSTDVASVAQPTTAVAADGEEFMAAADALPRILIPSLGLSSEIILPQSTELSILNAALYKGPVLYPGSATPGETGNVFIFGHSSLLSVVHNQNFKIFNGLKDLKPMDSIRIQWDGREYWYQVHSVSVEKANDAHINFATDKKLLTLSTCRIIGGKEDRYVVEAEFVKSYPLKII